MTKCTSVELGNETDFSKYREDTIWSCPIKLNQLAFTECPWDYKS